MGEIMHSLAIRTLGDDTVLETDHLGNHGCPDVLALNGAPVCLYGCNMDNENSSGRRVGGNAFFAQDGGVGCIHH